MGNLSSIPLVEVTLDDVITFNKFRQSQDYLKDKYITIYQYGTFITENDIEDSPRPIKMYGEFGSSSSKYEPNYYSLKFNDSNTMFVNINGSIYTSSENKITSVEN